MRRAALRKPCGSVGTEERRIRQMGERLDVTPVGFILEIVLIGSCSAAAAQSLVPVASAGSVYVCVCVSTLVQHRIPVGSYYRIYSMSSA